MSVMSEKEAFDEWLSVSLCVQGQATDIAIQAEEILKLKRQINNIYAKHTGQPLETIGRHVPPTVLQYFQVVQKFWIMLFCFVQGATNRTKQ